jgi:hypothetical protein
MAIRHNARTGDSAHRSAKGCAAIAGAMWCCIAAAVAAPDIAASARQRSDHVAPAVKRALRAPLPPRRPAPPPVNIEQPPAPPPELPPLDTSAPPPSLPRAPRERMRLCATQWLKLRQERQTSGTTWRDFATECLTR